MCLREEEHWNDIFKYDQENGNFVVGQEDIEMQGEMTAASSLNNLDDEDNAGGIERTKSYEGERRFEMVEEKRKMLLFVQLKICRGM